MANPVLHIKDSYYFEVPKVLYPYEYRSASQFPDVWISLDPEFQDWEAERLLAALSRMGAGLPPKGELLEQWHHWQHADHANFAKPLEVFLEEKYDASQAQFQPWKNAQVNAAKAQPDGNVEKARRLEFRDYLDALPTTGAGHEYIPFLAWRARNENPFEAAKTEAGGREAISAWREEVREGQVADWSKQKIAGYNRELSGKILIPQPFGTQRNFYERESGFCISKYMILEVVVGLILVVVFSGLARRMERGGAPRGKLWNFLESFLVFIRDQIVRPSIGGHHEEDSLHPEHGHELGGPYAEHGRADHGKTVVALEREEENAAAHGAGAGASAGHAGHHAAAHGHLHPDMTKRFLPLFWTIFFFVLGCNLFGMVPWAGAPTAAFNVTLALAAVTFATVIVFGMLEFGFFGFFMNQVPGMDLPWYMAIVLKPMIMAIELLGLCIKHGVLAIRLLANMVAGHLVLLGVMGLAFGAEAALYYSQSDVAGWKWLLTATIAVVGSAAFSILELFVAFLQAYIFTFLSALFVGAAIHKH